MGRVCRRWCVTAIRRDGIIVKAEREATRPFKFKSRTVLLGLRLSRYLCSLNKRDCFSLSWMLKYVTKDTQLSHRSQWIETTAVDQQGVLVKAAIQHRRVSPLSIGLKVCSKFCIPLAPPASESTASDRRVRRLCRPTHHHQQQPA